MANGQAQMLNLAGGLPPEILQQQQALNRQQQMAQLLMQQGQQMPQGQMVSGRYVAPSFFQYAAPLLQTFVGQRLAEKGDKAAVELAQQLRNQQQKMGEQYFEALQGKPATYGADIPTETYETVKGAMISPATGPDYRKAFSIATDPYAPSWLKAQAAEMLKPQKVGEGEKVIRFNPATGKNEVVAEGGEKYRAPIQVDVGNRYELRDPRDPTKILQVIPKTLSPAESINMTYEGKIGGMPSGGGAMPNMGGQTNVVAQTGATAQVKKEDEKFIPVVMPQYQYNPQLSPKQNQEMAMKFNEKNLTNINNAKDSFDYLKQAAQILASNKPSSGRLENIVTGTREFFGGGGEASKTDAQLNVLAGGLTMKQPRFEGPQGVLDVQLYQKLAGDVGNPNVPIASRLGAIQQMVELQKKYYPNADWESIDISGPVVKKNVLGGTRGLGAKTMSPTEFKQSLAPQDKEAFEWATKNPNDPRSAQIKKRLGVE